MEVIIAAIASILIFLFSMCVFIWVVGIVVRWIMEEQPLFKVLKNDWDKMKRIRLR